MHNCLQTFAASMGAISSAIPVDEFTDRMQEMYLQGRQPFKREYEVSADEVQLPEPMHALPLYEV